MITFDSVSKYYDGVPAVKDISLQMDKGEMAFVIGPSGAGKTTLLKIIYHGEVPEEGSLSIAGWNTARIKESLVPALRRNIGVVFQDFRLLPNRRVYDNIAIALRLRGIDESSIKPLVYETLRLVNLRHKTEAYPKTLSGGEQQRVVIARAIIGEPMIILADEPTGNLDPETARDIMRIFKEINARGTTILIATHNEDLYRHTGLRVFRLEAGMLQSEQRG